MKFRAKITGHGPDAFTFLGDPDTNFIIIFNEDAPDALAELCVLHEITDLHADVVAGDLLIINNVPFTVSAVGSEANATLRGLGHCTLDFKGGPEPERPGCIMLEGEKPLTQDDLKAGALIEIY
ncbi:MAG: PTS glucitol/sorbitol transporter subunit IIA [Lachnospiraceae bacterium]|nr:PTS glucitol/sorbitol transporter subunit IIA [Lachnospiraceae bacterium]